MAHILDGTYTVRFESSLGMFGAGVVVLSDLSVSGGDSGFLFSGKFREEANQLAGQVNVKQHSPGVPSVFGPMTDFFLDLRGSFENGQGVFGGHIVGQPNLKLKVLLEKVKKPVHQS